MVCSNRDKRQRCFSTGSVIRSDRRERREQEALKVMPSVGPVGGLVPDAEGRVPTEMLITVANGGLRSVGGVKVQLFHGSQVDTWVHPEIPPMSSVNDRRTPTDADFAKYNSGQVFDVDVQVTFTDADGKRWLRNSQGMILSLSRRQTGQTYGVNRVSGRRMVTALIGAGAALAGLLIGYLVRLNEFRRDRRLTAYSEFIGAFLVTAHSGAALVSAGAMRGEAFHAAENHAESALVWDTYGAALQEFESATARLRLVGSDAARIDSEALEDFIVQNIENVEPKRRGSGVSKGGAAAQVGPVEIDRQAVRLARLFADRSHGEVTRWRRPPRPQTSIVDQMTEAPKSGAS